MNAIILAGDITGLAFIIIAFMAWFVQTCPRQEKG